MSIVGLKNNRSDGGFWGRTSPSVAQNPPSPTPGEREVALDAARRTFPKTTFCTVLRAAGNRSVQKVVFVGAVHLPPLSPFPQFFCENVRFVRGSPKAPSGTAGAGQTAGKTTQGTVLNGPNPAMCQRKTGCATVCCNGFRTSGRFNPFLFDNATFCYHGGGDGALFFSSFRKDRLPGTDGRSPSPVPMEKPYRTSFLLFVYRTSGRFYVRTGGRFYRTEGRF